MRRSIFSVLLVICGALSLSAQEFKVITSVESIVSSGLGRSRIIDGNEEKDYAEYTSTQTEETRLG